MDLELRVKIPNRSCPGVIVDPPEERLIFRRQHLLKPRSSFSRPSFNSGFIDSSSHCRTVFQLYGSRSHAGAYQYGHHVTRGVFDAGTATSSTSIDTDIELS